MTKLDKKNIIIVLASFLSGIPAVAMNILVPKAAEVEEIKKIMNELEADLKNAILKNRIKELSKNLCCYHGEIILKNEKFENPCCCHDMVLLAQEKKAMEHKMELLDKFKMNCRTITEILMTQVSSESSCCEHLKIPEESSENLCCSH
jgi:hypothetical protein